MSVMLYGNSVAKQVNKHSYTYLQHELLLAVCIIYQVYFNLQPLNNCLSHQKEMRTVQKISLDYDDVIMWGKKLHDLIEMPTSNYVNVYTWFLLINQLAK